MIWQVVTYPKVTSRLITLVSSEIKGEVILVFFSI